MSTRIPYYWLVILLASLITLLPARTNGQQASTCTAANCGLNADCENDTCACPTDYEGNPNLYCAPPGSDTCFAIGDPSLRSFSNFSSRINFPCKVTLSQFDTTLTNAGARSPTSIVPGSQATFSTSTPDINMCRTIVQSDTRMSVGGQYYTKSLDIHVIINVGDSPENIEIHLEAGSVHYVLNGGTNTYVRDGQCRNVFVRGRIANICNFVSKQIWRVSVSDCGGLVIVFRPWNLILENQNKKVGVGIITAPNAADFSDPSSAYPVCMCDINDLSQSDVYKSYKNSKGLATRFGSTLFAFLDNPPPGTQPDQDCNDVLQTWNNCPVASQVGAVNTCSPILFDYAVCAEENSMIPIQVFHNCLTGYCGTEKVPCAIARVQINSTSCPNPPNFNC